MSGRERIRRPLRTALRAAGVALALLLVALCFFPNLVRQAPLVARELWNLVGVRRVEGHAAELRAAAAESGLDPCLLAAVMYAESRGKADAVSARGALGAFQLMPSAAGDAAKRLGLGQPSRDALLSDVLLGARLSACHLAWLVQHEGPDLERVLVAYNAGRTKLRRWIDAEGGYAAWREQRVRDGGGGTLAYARLVLSMRERFRERGAISPPVTPLGGTGGDLATGLPE